MRKATKTNKARTIPLTPKIQLVLARRKPEGVKADDLVFPAPSGVPINDRLFSRRAWSSVLKQVGVEYRSPYNTRHTFISHCLQNGMNPVVVAQITGHDIQTMYDRYVGCVVDTSILPDLF